MNVTSRTINTCWAKGTETGRRLQFYFNWGSFGTPFALLRVGSGSPKIAKAVRGGIETRQCLGCPLRGAI